MLGGRLVEVDLGLILRPLVMLDAVGENDLGLDAFQGNPRVAITAAGRKALGASTPTRRRQA